MMAVLQTVLFSFTLWLGFYLLARNAAKPLLRLIAFGLLAYAGALATDLLSRFAPGVDAASASARWHWLLIFLPAFFWSGAALHLLPEDAPYRQALIRSWRFGFTPLVTILGLLSVTTHWVLGRPAAELQPGPLFPAFAAIIVLPMLAGLEMVARAYQLAKYKKPFGLLITAVLFFTLSTGLLVLPLRWIPHAWALVFIGLDLGLLGFAIASLDALEEGETLLPDFMRSLVASGLAALLFGGLVLLAMAIEHASSFAWLTLLLATVAAAIATQTFSASLQAAVDRVVFARFPHLRQTRPRSASARFLPQADRPKGDGNFTRLSSGINRPRQHMPWPPPQASTTHPAQAVARQPTPS